MVVSHYVWHIKTKDICIVALSRRFCSNLLRTLNPATFLLIFGSFNIVTKFKFFFDTPRLLAFCVHLFFRLLLSQIMVKEVDM